MEDCFPWRRGGGGSLLVNGKGQTVFGFWKTFYNIYLWVCYLMHNWCSFGVADEKI